MLHLQSVQHMLLLYSLFLCTLIQAHAAQFQKDFINGTITKNLSPFYPQQQATSMLLEKTASSTRFIAATELSRNFENELFSIRDNELMIPIVQNFYDSFHSSGPMKNHNSTDILMQIAGKIDGKIQNATKLIDQASAHIATLLNNLTASDSSITEKNATSNKSDADKLFLESIVMPCQSNVFLCNDNVNGCFSANLCPDKNVTDFLENCRQIEEFYDRNFTINTELVKYLAAIWDKARLNKLPNFRDVYFLAKDNWGDTGKCGSYSMNRNYRRLLTSSIKSKNIVMVLDHGASEANEEHFKLAKSFGKFHEEIQSQRAINQLFTIPALDVINLLNDRDSMTILAISDKVSSFNEYFLQQLATARSDQNRNDEPKTVNLESPLIHVANADTKNYFINFLKTLNKTKELTNHTLAFENAFNLIAKITSANRFQRNTNENMSPLLLLYVSRGLLSEPSEVKEVLKAIAVGQSHLTKPITINTCAIILDDKRIMYEKQFLTDIATQNYSKFNIDVQNNLKTVQSDQKVTRTWFDKLSKYNESGRMLVVNKRIKNDIIGTATAIISNVWFNEANLIKEIQQHAPFYDYSTKDIVLPFTRSCGASGIFGISLHLSDLAEDIIYYFNRNSGGSYAFLLDRNGFTLWHPSFPRPQVMRSNDTVGIDIRLLENISESVKGQWLQEINGNITITSQHADEIKTYTWQHISSFFIICIARIIKSSKQSNSSLPLQHQHLLNQLSGNLSDSIYSLANKKDDALDNLVYHRLDLQVDVDRKPNATNIQLCRYFNSLSVQSNVVLFLSAGAFTSPFDHLYKTCNVSIYNDRSIEHDQCLDRIKEIMSYVKDEENMTRNPGLQPQVRNDVITAAHVMDLLQKQQWRTDNELNKFIIRRYLTTINGVMLMYPGCTLANEFEPSRRLWFQKVMENPGKLIITEPYLDACGAGYVVTVSYAIYEIGSKKYAKYHSSSSRSRRSYTNEDTIIAIVSIDVTRPFFYRLLLKSSEMCQNNEHIKCFLIESTGYIIVHPSILQPVLQNTNGIYERSATVVEHITHKESFVASDMLFHRNLVEKTLCQNQWSQKIQRSYKFNMSMTDILTNYLNGERSRYEIKALPYTNTLLMVINTTNGTGGTAFCPCSTVDQICLNCNRIELLNCECPCECPLNANLTLNDSDEQIIDPSDPSCINADCFNSINICPTPIEPTIPKKVDWPQDVWLMDSCLNYSCEFFTSQWDCIGIVGCEWCRIDVDGLSLLNSPFCTHQFACYDGVLGSLTPYGEGELGAMNVDIDTLLPSAYAAIVPMFAAIVVLCLVIGAAMYCYRQSLDPSSEQLYVDYLPAQHNFGLPISLLDYDSIIPHSNGMDKSDNSIILQSDASPYCMPAGNFRQPNGESDYGYSTMTPHEDSDHICFNLVEPLISSKRSNVSTSDSLSTNADRLISPNTPSPVNHVHQHYHHHYHNHHIRNPITKRRDSAISPTDPCDNNGTTLLSLPHQIQAPVTVHKEMEAS